MFDNMYTRLISRVAYKPLVGIPIAIAILMIMIILIYGIPLGIDFKGGTQIRVSTFNDVDVVSLENELQALGLEDLEVYIAKEMATGINRLTIETVTDQSTLDEKNVLGVVEKYTGKLNKDDVASLYMKEPPSKDMIERLENRFKKQNADVRFNETTSTLQIIAMHIDEEDLKSGVDYCFRDTEIDVDTDKVQIERLNLLYHPVSPTMGDEFMKRGIIALCVAYLLMSLVVFVVFRAFIPAMAVILAATCDIIIAAGGMTILGLKLQPASLAALLMLIGYSVDSDILLTTRVLKGRGKADEVDSRIDDAMKTGLTMTFTTLFALTAILIVSSYLAQIAVLTAVASVLLLGLLADLFTTWFMNAGILKWYASKPRKRRRKKSRFGIRLFSG